MNPSPDDRSHRPLRPLRFLAAWLLLLPALLSGYVLPLSGPAAIDVLLPFTAAVLVFPTTRRRRAAGIALAVLSLSTFNLIRTAYLHWAVFEPVNADAFRVFVVTLAIVGFLAWGRWARDERR